MSQLAGKVAIVTGAGQGIGRSEARALARVGAHVIVNDIGRDPADADTRTADVVVAEITEAGGSAEANYSDITSWDGGRELVEQALGRNGNLDILLCNAGIVRDRTLSKMDMAEWQAVLDVHLNGHFVPMRFAAEHWRNRSHETGNPVDATIIATSSESGLWGNFGQANYSAAKAGIIALTQVAARELASAGVTANVICPRARTPMTEGVVQDMDPAPGEVDEWDPERIMPWIVYLAGSAARDISGEVFVVHGNTIKRMEPWAPLTQVRRTEGYWDQEGLGETVDQLSEGKGASMRLGDFWELRDQQA